MTFEFRKRYQRIVYTLKHKIAFLKVEKQLRGKNTLRGYLHDIDKPFLYMAFWIDLKDVQKIHRNHSKHHIRNCLKKSKEDLIDTIIDWECARMTKPDKPLNAYETLMKFYPEYKHLFLPLIYRLLPEQVINSYKTSLNKRQNEYCSKDKMHDNQKTIKKSLMLSDAQRSFLRKLNQKSR